MAGPIAAAADRSVADTGQADSQNAREVAATLGSRDHPVTLAVDEIGISGERIIAAATPVPALVTIDDGHVYGRDVRFDQTRAVGTGFGRAIACAFPMPAAGDLSMLERGDLPGFAPAVGEVYPIALVGSTAVCPVLHTGQTRRNRLT